MYTWLDLLFTCQFLIFATCDNREIVQIVDLDVPCKLHVIRCDNKSAIDFTRNKIERSRTKHIDIAYHISRESGLIELKYVSSNDNMADIFTKSLHYTVMNKHIQKLGLQLIAEWSKWGIWWVFLIHIAIIFIRCIEHISRYNYYRD